MAVQLYQPRSKPNAVLRLFAQQAGTAIREHFRVQKVFPYEIYPGFTEINAKRLAKGEWAATGEGVKSIHAESDATPGHESVTISYLDHLRFVDMGVVAMHKLDIVRRDAKAKADRRYVNRWIARAGETHRPILMMEARHVQHRMQNYFEDYYGRDLLVRIYNTIEGIEINL